MNPKDKAKELFDNCNSILINDIEDEFARKYASINCALLVPRECIRVLGQRDIMSLYWLEVKEELKKL